MNYCCFSVTVQALQFFSDVCCCQIDAGCLPEENDCISVYNILAQITSLSGKTTRLFEL